MPDLKMLLIPAEFYSLRWLGYIHQSSTKYWNFSY